jgi:hypothetical protein
VQTPEGFTNTLAGCITPDAIEADFLAELAKLKAESLGWIPLEDGAYLHVSDLTVTEEIEVGVPQVRDAVLLVG